MPVDRLGNFDEQMVYLAKFKKPCRACVDFKTWAKITGKENVNKEVSYLNISLIRDLEICFFCAAILCTCDCLHV